MTEPLQPLLAVIAIALVVYAAMCIRQQQKRLP
jgi:preprotein translocase subunit YajC